MSTIPAPPALVIRPRWISRGDLPSVLSIDTASFSRPWDSSDFERIIGKRNHFCMVADHRGRVVGSVVYCLRRTSISLLRFAVDPGHRNQGVGRQMAARLIAKLTPDRRVRISLLERGSNLDGHLFWSAMGFKAVDVEREAWRDNGEEGYRFEYPLAAQRKDDPAPRPISRALEEIYVDRVRKQLMEGGDDA